MKAKNILIALVIIIAIGAFSLIGTYNSLVQQSQAIDSQWAQVETQYQRRFDLIPNLVESAKGYMSHEQEVFDNLATARQGYAGAQSIDEKAQAAGEVESALARLLVIMENYPDLKANESVKQLMDELAGTENRIAVERKRYNDNVKVYNTNIKTFPNVLIVGMFGFGEKSYFEAVESAETAPQVNFGE